MPGIDGNETRGSGEGEEVAAATGGAGKAALTMPTKAIAVVGVEEEEGRQEHLGDEEIKCRATVSISPSDEGRSIPPTILPSDGEDRSIPPTRGSRNARGAGAPGVDATPSITGLANAALDEDQMEDFVEPEDDGGAQQQRQQQHALGRFIMEERSVGEDAGEIGTNQERHQLAPVAREESRVTDTVGGSTVASSPNNKGGEEQNHKTPAPENIRPTPERDTTGTDSGYDGTAESEVLCGDLARETRLAHEQHIRRILNKFVDKREREGALSIAVRNGHEAIVEILLDGVRTMHVNDDDFLAACQKGHWGIVKRLLVRADQLGHVIRLKALEAAISTANAEAMRLFADRDFLNIPVGPHGQTRLFEHAELGNKPIVEALLAAGASVNKADHNKRTPLLAAVVKGRDEIVNILISWEADVNCSDSVSRTPLTVATAAGNLNMVRKLLASKAVPTTEAVGEAVGHGFNEILMELLAASDEAGQLLQRGLALALSCGKETIAKSLLGATNPLGERISPALKSAIENDHVATAKFLINGTDTHRLNPTLLHFAAMKGHNGYLNLLLEKGLLIDARDERSNTPLEVATNHGQESSVEFLLQHGALADGRSKCDQSLRYAVVEGLEAAAKNLIAAGADYNLQGGIEGGIPLHYAVKAGCLPLVKLLDMSGRPVIFCLGVKKSEKMG